jgi:sterol desaturase/sphingolipid hydroxylase (fatty acid hydroxylase superfamily)
MAHTRSLGPDEGRAKKLEPSSLPSVTLRFLGALAVWPAICALPLVLAGDARYRSVFPSAWFDEEPQRHPVGAYGYSDPMSVKPLGLTLGILAVAVGQVFVLIYHALRREQWLGATRRVQNQDREYEYFEGLKTHLSQPEGFALIGGYLIGSWMLGWMPASYYSFAGGINWCHVAAQLLLQDGIQYIMHIGEHKVSSWIYRNSHKPHHRFTNPRLFDAFNGSLTDTLLMIIVPFLVVVRIVPANVWSYMTFGSIYANWLVLIHSEYAHPWDAVFRKIGFGTASDHHVHHRFFVFNYGHLFMYWDRLAGTYRDPAEFEGAHFSKSA